MNTPDERVFGERRDADRRRRRGRAAGRLPRRPGRPLRGRDPGPRGGAAARPRRAGRARRLRLRRRGRPRGSPPPPPRSRRRACGSRRSRRRSSEIPGRLAEAHLGVVPTLRDDFTELLLPVKLLEYVHMGLPVVASRAAGDRALLRRRRAACRARRPRLASPPRSKACAPSPRRPASAPSAPPRAWPRSSGGASASGYLELVDGLVERAAERAEMARAAADHPRPRRGRPPGADDPRRSRAQTRPPDLWLIVDDGSTDATPRILERAARPSSPSCGSCSAPRRRRARARTGSRSRPRRAPSTAPWPPSTLDEFTHVGKLDADIELPAGLLRAPARALRGRARARRRRRHPARATAAAAGGRPRSPTYHVRGALKLYSRECFEAIGGIEERLGWDTIDETYARMRGYTTRSLPELAARHHRPVATRGGTLRGRARHGQCAYILRYGAWWVALRSLKVACSAPLRALRHRLLLRLPALRRAPRRPGRGRAVPALRRPRAARSGAGRGRPPRQISIAARTRKFLRFSCVHKPMAFVDTIRQLWRRKLLVGLVFVVAVVAALFSAYRFSTSPPACEKRALQRRRGLEPDPRRLARHVGAGQRASKPDTFEALATRAKIYAQYLARLRRPA